MLSKLDDVQVRQSERGLRKSSASSIFIIILVLLFGCMYALFHYFIVSDVVVFILNLSGMVLAPSMYYVLFEKRSSGKVELIYITFVAAVGVTYLITPSEQNSLLQALLHWIIPIAEFVLALYVIIRIYRIVKSYKLSRSNSKAQPMDIMREVLTPLLGNSALLEIVITELSVVYYSIIAWFRKPVMTEHGGFSYNKQSQVKPIVLVFIAIIILETVGLHVLISIWSEILAWIATGINVYAIAYMIAFSNSFHYLPIMLDEQHLRIRLGFQCDINIPLQHIESINPAKEIGIGENVPKDVYMAYLRFDTPQFRIQLKEPVAVKNSFGISKNYSVIIFRVDDPQRFAAQLDELTKNNQMLTML